MGLISDHGQHLGRTAFAHFQTTDLYASQLKESYDSEDFICCLSEGQVVTPSREGNRVPNVGDMRHGLEYPVETNSKSSVWCVPETAEISIPL